MPIVAPKVTFPVAFGTYFNEDYLMESSHFQIGTTSIV